MATKTARRKTNGKKTARRSASAKPAYGAIIAMTISKPDLGYAEISEKLGARCPKNNAYGRFVHLIARETRKAMVSHHK